MYISDYIAIYFLFFTIY